MKQLRIDRVQARGSQTRLQARWPDEAVIDNRLQRESDNAPDHVDRGSSRSSTLSLTHERAIKR